VRHPDLYRRHERGFTTPGIPNGAVTTLLTVTTLIGISFALDTICPSLHYRQSATPTGTSASPADVRLAIKLHPHQCPQVIPDLHVCLGIVQLIQYLSEFLYRTDRICVLLN
jgi:hypothetical protein